MARLACQLVSAAASRRLPLHTGSGRQQTLKCSGCLRLTRQTCPCLAHHPPTGLPCLARLCCAAARQIQLSRRAGQGHDRQPFPARMCSSLADSRPRPRLRHAERAQQHWLAMSAPTSLPECTGAPCTRGWRWAARTDAQASLQTAMKQPASRNRAAKAGRGAAWLAQARLSRPEERQAPWVRRVPVHRATSTRWPTGGASRAGCGLYGRGSGAPGPADGRAGARPAANAGPGPGAGRVQEGGHLRSRHTHRACSMACLRASRRSASRRRGLQVSAP